MTDVIRISGLSVDCIVGILPEERQKPQALVVEIDLSLDLTRAALTSDLAATVDYAAMAREVAFILQAGQFLLIETAALALCSHLAVPPVLAASVKVTKPGALGGRGVPSAHLERQTASFHRDGPWIFRSPECSVLLLTKGDEVEKSTGPWSAHEDLARADGRTLRVCRK